jgi:hypothetical protein
MRQIYLGNTLINDAFLGDDRMSDVLTPTPQIQYLIIGGGASGGGTGGGGNVPRAGGGGAGGLKSGSFALPTSTTTYTVLVGAGGTASIGGGVNGKNGSRSLFANIEALGGGGGGSNSTNGLNGASGGGGGGISSGTTVGGTGISGQGFNGGGVTSTVDAFGGGGGASQVGSLNTPGSGSFWVDGIEYSIGGGGRASTSRYNEGGLYGNGGDGASGGGGDRASLAGKAGAVIIRYNTEAVAAGAITGGDEIVTIGNYTYHKFTNVATSSLLYTI